MIIIKKKKKKYKPSSTFTKDGAHLRFYLFIYFQDVAAWNKSSFQIIGFPRFTLCIKIKMIINMIINMIIKMKIKIIIK